MYFADLCEAMAGTLAMQPASLRPVLDRSTVLTTPFVAGAQSAHRSAQPILNPRTTDAPTPRDLSRPVRFGVLGDLFEEDGASAGFHLCHVHAASKAELRAAGRLPFLSPYPHLAVSLAILQPFERAREYTHGFVGWHSAEKMWVRFGPNIRPAPDASLHERVALSLSMQFSARYDWHVTIAARPGAPRIALPCAPSEARKLFAGRDLPPGRSRRAALRHWVTEHFRGVQTERPVGVRSHFRGAQAFDWAGLSCAVEPSEYDRDRVGQKPERRGDLRGKAPKVGP